MKHLLIIFSLLAFITPAHAGELDGKGLICKPDKPKKKFDVSIYYFENGEVTNILAPNRIRKSGVLTRKMGVYSARNFEITWWSMDLDNKEIVATYKVDRQTLKMKSIWKLFGTTNYTCRVAENKRAIGKYLKQRIRRIQSEKKKNKL